MQPLKAFCSNKRPFYCHTHRHQNIYLWFVCQFGVWFSPFFRVSRHFVGRPVCTVETILLSLPLPQPWQSPIQLPHAPDTFENWAPWKNKIAPHNNNKHRDTHTHMNTRNRAFCALDYWLVNDIDTREPAYVWAFVWVLYVLRAIEKRWAHEHGTHGDALISRGRFTIAQRHAFGVSPRQYLVVTLLRNALLRGQNISHSIGHICCMCMSYVYICSLGVCSFQIKQHMHDTSLYSQHYRI